MLSEGKCSFIALVLVVAKRVAAAKRSVEILSKKTGVLLYRSNWRYLHLLPALHSSSD